MDFEHIWDDDFPKRIYKYMRREHADALLTNGRLLLSGLESYPLVDKDEGTLTAEIDQLDHGEIHGSGPSVSAIKTNLDRVAQVSEVASGTRFENCQIVRRTGNAIVFCTSAACSRDTMRACNPAYDTCVEILDVGSFIGHLDSFIRERTQGPLRCLVGRCKYSRREYSVRDFPPFDGLEMAFVKPARYALEQEFRVLWTAKLPRDVPLPIECAGLTNLCVVREMVA